MLGIRGLLVMREVPDLRETNCLFFDHDHYECDIINRPEDKWENPKPRQLSKRKIAKIWYVPVEVPEFDGAFTDFWLHEEFLISELKDLGFEVDIYGNGSADSLISMLQGEADYRLVAGHGDECGGIRATDRFVEWDEIIENIGSTGILHMLSCWSYDAVATDEEEEVYDFVDDGIIRSSEVSSAIVCHKMGHHFPGIVKSTGNSFEISRMMCILERCLSMGFREGFESYRKEITAKMGSLAKPFTDHEIAVGNPN